MEKEKLFKDEKYYRWKSENNKLIIFPEEKAKVVVHGEAVKGSELNEAVSDLRFGYMKDWEELDTKDLDGAIEKIEKLTLEQCFEILPDPMDSNNENDYYPSIKSYNMERGQYGWNVTVNDWYGMKDQACFYDSTNENILHALQDCIVFLVARGIISKDVL